MPGGVLLATEIPFWRRDSGVSQRIAALCDVIAGDQIPLTVYYPNTLNARDQKALTRHRRMWTLETLPLTVAFARGIRRRIGRLLGDTGLGPAHAPEALKRPWPGERIRHFQALCNKLQPDVIVIEYLLAAYLLDDVSATKAAKSLKVIDTIDVLSERVRSFKRRGVEAPLIITPEEEAQALAPFDVILAIQDHEAPLLQQMAPGKRVVLVGHGQEITPIKRAAGGPPHALFFASQGEHNKHALNHLLDKLWPEIHRQVPEAELMLAGGICDDLDTINVTGVKVLGRVKVPKEAYEEADIVLNPVHAGSGLKIKNVEALCFAMPVVTTSLGAEGLDNAADHALIVADEDDAFISAAVGLLRDPQRRADLASAAETFARAHLSAKEAFAPLLEILREACHIPPVEPA